MNNTNNVTIAEISTKITIAITDRTPWWEKDGENNRRRKQLAEAMNLHGWELDGIPSILKHIYSMIETGTITARSTVNGLKPNSISQIAANTANWYVSSTDAKRIFSELTSLIDVELVENVVKKSKNRTKVQQQQDAIISELKRLDYEPLDLPALVKGQRSAKADVRDVLNGKDLFAAGSAFENSWQELVRRKLIKYAS